MTRLCIARRLKEKKFRVQRRPFCSSCRRTRGLVFYRRFGLCRICIRMKCREGLLPGWKKINF